MARKEDSSRDRQAKAILAQVTTKTVGPPLVATGLIGDQTPDTVFTVADFDKVRNQINLELANVEALNLLNTLGRITNMQSQSGPIVGTQKFITVTTTAQGTITWDRPDKGQIWQLLAAAVSEDDASYHNIYLIDDDGNTLFIAQETTATKYDPFLGLPLTYSYENYLGYNIPTSPGGGNNTIVGSVIRVR